MIDGEHILDIANEIHLGALSRLKQASTSGGIYFESSKPKYDSNHRFMPGQSRCLINSNELRLMVDYTRDEIDYDEVVLTVRQQPDSIPAYEGYKKVDVVQYIVHPISEANPDPEIHAFRYDELVPSHPLYGKRRIMEAKQLFISPKFAKTQPSLLVPEVVLPGFKQNLQQNRSPIRVFSEESLQMISNSLLYGKLGIITCYDRPIEDILQ